MDGIYRKKVRRAQTLSSEGFLYESNTRVERYSIYARIVTETEQVGARVCDGRCLYTVLPWMETKRLK